jgi:hypothetical protein
VLVIGAWFQIRQSSAARHLDRELKGWHDGPGRADGGFRVRGRTGGQRPQLASTDRSSLRAGRDRAGELAHGLATLLTIPPARLTVLNAVGRAAARSPAS